MLRFLRFPLVKRKWVREGRRSGETFCFTLNFPSCVCPADGSTDKLHDDNRTWHHHSATTITKKNKKKKNQAGSSITGSLSLPISVNPHEAMLQPHLARLLNTEGTLLERCLEDDCVEPLPGRCEASQGSPFNFSPQLIHLHKDHELFEVKREAEPTDTAYSCTWTTDIDIWCVKTMSPGWWRQQTHVPPGLVRLRGRRKSNSQVGQATFYPPETIECL